MLEQQIPIDEVILTGNAIFEKYFELLTHQDNRVHDKVILEYQKLIDKGERLDELKQLQNQLIDDILRLINWSQEFFTHKSPGSYVSMLFKTQFPDIVNKTKIMQQMTDNTYIMITLQHVIILGLLKAFECLLVIQNTRISEIIEIIVRTSQHINKYVRIISGAMIEKLLKYINDQRFTKTIYGSIHALLTDESIEARCQALKLIKQLENVDGFANYLLINCHFENIADDYAEFCKQRFPSNGGPPILGVIKLVVENCLESCLNLCYHFSISRYYQIRASSLATLMSLVLFLREKQNLLPIQKILTVAQNNTIYESDPQVRSAGFKLLYHTLRLNSNELTFKKQIVENCLFHLSDVPQVSKEYAAKTLALLSDEFVFKMTLSKFDLIKDQEKVFKDFIGFDVVPENIKQQLDQSIESQGGKGKVIHRHTIQIIFGLSYYFSAICSLPEKNQEQLSLFLLLLSDAMRIALFQEMDQYRPFIYEQIVNGLYELKSVKRLPIKVIDSCDILTLIVRDKQNQQLQRLEELVGKNVLQGRL